MNKIILVFCIIFLSISAFSEEKPPSSEAVKKVHLIKFTDQSEFMVDKVIATYIHNALEDAKSADMVIIEIDTYGGMIIAASKIRESINAFLLDTDKKIVAYIPNKAVSAGAAITVACSEIVMREGAHFGDSAPVMQDPETGKLKMLNDNDKITSVLRKDFETSCKKNGYPYRLGHAMVSQSWASYVLYESSKVKIYSFEEFESLSENERKNISGGDIPKRTEFYIPEHLSPVIQKFSDKEETQKDNQTGKKDEKTGSDESENTSLAATDKIVVVIDEVFEVDGERLCFLSESPDSERDFTSLSKSEKTYIKKKLLSQIDSEKRMLELSAEQAYKYHFASKVVKSREELYDYYNLKASDVVEIKPSGADTVVRWLNHPLIASLLIIIGLISLFIEVYTPGMGIGIIVAVTSFGAYFLFAFLAYNPSILPVILFIAGIVLILLEVFVIPGFGITGISGILCVIFGLLLVRIPAEYFSSESGEAWSFALIAEPLIVVFGGFIAGVIGMIIVARYLPETRVFSKFIVSGPERIESAAESGVAVSNIKVEVASGDEGVVTSDLRPSGKIEIKDHVLPAVSNGDFIEKGTAVRVIKVRGNQVIVEKA